MWSSRNPNHKLYYCVPPKPTIGQHVFRPKALFDCPFDHRNRLRNFIPGAFFRRVFPGDPGTQVFLYCSLPCFPRRLFSA